MTGSELELADEAVDEGRIRGVIDLVGGADLFDLALAHDDDAVGEFQRLLLVVGDEDGGVAGGVVDIAQPAAKLAADLSVERAERLVEQQHFWLDRHGARKRDALALAAGELGGISLLQPGELHEVKQLGGAAANLRLGRPRRAGPHFQAEADILGDGHVLEQRVMLEHEADIALLHGLVGSVLVAEIDRAAGRPLQPGDQAKQRRLARAGRPEKRYELARPDVERDLAQGREAVEFLAHIDDANFHAG